MPIQAPQWTEFLACPVCTKDFNEDPRPPISLGCGHTICKLCLSKLSRQLCPYDQTEIHAPVDDIPINHGLLQLLIPNHERPETVTVGMPEIEENQESFDFSRMCIEDLAKYLLPFSGLPNGFTGNGVNNGKMMEQLSRNAVVGALNNGTTNGGLTRPMQRKLVTLVNCQLIEEEGRCKAIRAARSLGERTVKELILLHQNPQHLSTNLWTAVRNRGCQFLGPAMQEEVLKLILLALEDGNSLSRKVLVLFVVQKLESKFTQASKTSIGHVVQLLYRASCFKVTKREGDSSLLQLHEKFRTYSALRKEHDAQVVQIAMEAGLHISPEQWSALLYGDDDHKSHMQSIIDKLQTPASFSSSIQELIIALQRTQDPADLQRLREDLERLADIDPSPEGPPPTWEELRGVMESLKFVVNGLVDFTQNYSSRLKGTMEAQQTQNNKYKTSMCRDILRRASCPRGSQCSFAHTGEELEKFRKKKGGVPLQVAPVGLNRSGSSSPPEATGTPNGLENGMNGSRESPDEIIRNGSNGTQGIPVLSVTDSMQNGAYYKRNFANVNYQRLSVQPEPQVNSIPVTYLPAAVQQIQPARTMYANGNEPPLGVYYSANQNSYIQAGMMLNAEQQCLPMATQQYMAYYPPQYRFPHATGRGTHEKDKDSSDLDKGCVSRDIITENIRDDLKLDTGRSSCSLFSSSKNNFIWRDSSDKIRGSSIGSGLDTSSEYSPETFSPLSNESCGSPQSSQMQSYGSTWNQFDPYHQSSKEGRDLSQHPSLSPLNGLAGSTIWSQGVDGDVFPDKSLLKMRSYSKPDWDQRNRNQAYRDLLMTKKDDDDKPVGFNYSGDTQSSFEEASSEDLGTSRYSEWSYNELKRVGAPPGLQQAPVLQPAPIGTPAKSKAHHYNGKVHERGEFPRAQSRRSFPSISSLDGIALD